MALIASLLAFLALLVSLLIFLIFVIMLSARESEIKGKMLSSTKPKELPIEDERILFQIDIQNLETFKNRQWQVTYYAVAIFGALIFLAQNELFSTSEKRYWLFVFALITVEYAVFRIIEIQFTLRRTRLSMMNYKLFYYTNYWMNPSEIDDLKRDYQKFSRDRGFYLVFIFTILSTYFLFVFLLFRTLNPLVIFPFLTP